MSDDTPIYLCHKCEGVLTGTPPAPTYHCHCISGWVRDWQTPTAPTAVRAKQIAQQRDWLTLYARQGRSEAAQADTKALLAKLLAG